LFYRITEVSFEPTSRDAIFEYADSVRDRMASIAGLTSAETVETGEGKMLLVAVYASEAQATEGAKIAQEILGGMAAHFTAMPTQQVGPVVWKM
jgi:hypothetical protein